MKSTYDVFQLCRAEKVLSSSRSKKVKYCVLSVSLRVQTSTNSTFLKDFVFVTFSESILKTLIIVKIVLETEKFPGLLNSSARLEQRFCIWRGHALDGK